MSTPRWSIPLNFYARVNGVFPITKPEKKWDTLADRRWSRYPKELHSHECNPIQILLKHFLQCIWVHHVHALQRWVWLGNLLCCLKQPILTITKMCTPHPKGLLWEDPLELGKCLRSLDEIPSILREGGVLMNHVAKHHLFRDLLRLRTIL